MERMFGPDGVRGVANRDLTPLLAYRLGRAFASRILAGGVEHPRILIGRDTRISGPMLEGALSAGVASTGVDVYLAGVVPTPAVAYLVRQGGISGGVMISASHNPVEDNGIKCFGPDGFKLTDSEEDEIEGLIRSMEAGTDELPAPIGGGVGRIMPYTDGSKIYADYIVSTADVDLSNLTIVVDCANGAAVSTAGNVFRRLGARVVELNVEPDGLNINVQCGSTHPEELREAVVRHEADVGFAFDGDADRVIAVDAKGEIVDGDAILAICGRHLLDANRLPKRTLAATVYSNLGLHDSINAVGGHVLTTKAGDRYVLEAMLEHGLTLGGEQSGHIIFLDYATTGDGLLTAVQLLRVMHDKQSSLADLAQVFQPYPQLLVNVRVCNKAGWEDNGRIAEAIKQAEVRLGDHGRLFVRASGTEPVIRVMGEAKEAAELEAIVQSVADVIAEELG